MLKNITYFIILICLTACNSSFKKIVNQKKFNELNNITIIANVPVDEQLINKNYKEKILEKSLKDDDYIFDESLIINKDSFTETIKNLIKNNSNKKKLKNFNIPPEIDFVLSQNAANYVAAFYVEYNLYFKKSKEKNMKSTQHIYVQRLESPIIHILVWNTKTSNIIYYNQTENNEKVFIPFSEKLEKLLINFKK